jgi:hypothetical protein
MDPDDSVLLEEILMIQYKFTPKGAILIESKDDMRSRGVKSPDSLDAAVYACADLSAIVSSPYGHKKPGDIVGMDYSTIEKEDAFLSLWNW